MKGIKRIKLLKSQKVLIQTKRRETINLIQAKQNELSEILKMVMIEQGVPEKEVDLWQLDMEGMAIEKMKPKKPPKKPPKDKDGEKGKK